jgi:solute carrier family 25 (mitochondrial S-adenosylmethionine transporter), member 26
MPRAALLPPPLEDGADGPALGYQFNLSGGAGRRKLVRTADSAAAGAAAAAAAAERRRRRSSRSAAVPAATQNHQTRTMPLASLTLSGPTTMTAEQQHQHQHQPFATRPMPLFVVAAAAATPAERKAARKKGAATTTTTAPPPPSAWRVTVGNLLAGGAAGCAVEAALYPIDTIKTRLQAAVGGQGWGALIKSGGGKALYAGVWGNLAGVLPSSALFMAVYEPVKQAVYARRDLSKDEAEFWGPVVAGMAAGLAASLTRVPTEVVKQRLQTGEFRGALGALRHIAAKEGVRRGLYAGYGAFLLRDLPFDAIEFVAYERLKVASRAALGRDPNAGEVSLIGAAAGGITGVVTTPLDVLKTRLMTQGASGQYKGVFDAAVGIVRSEGWGAMMAGWQPRLLWISLGGCVFFPCLEAAKRVFAPDGQTGYSSTSHHHTPVSTELVIEELEERDWEKAERAKRESGF